MSKARQMDGAPGKRAGLPLARANRLAESAEAKKGRGPTFIVATGLLTVAAIVSLGVTPGNTALDKFFNISDSSGAAPVLDVSKRPIARAEPVAEPAPVMEQTTAAAVEAPVETASVVEAIEPPAESAKEGRLLAMVGDNSNDPYCIQRIESRLVSLHAATRSGPEWNNRVNDVSQLVQTTLDCSHAGLQVIGSLELAGTGIADLRVSWNLETWTLDLAVVDSTNRDADLQVASASDQSIEFVVQ